MKLFILMTAGILFAGLNAHSQMLAPFIENPKVQTKSKTKADKDSVTKKKNIGVSFYALGAIGSTEKTVESVTASGRLAAELQIFDFFKLNIGANLLNANPSKKIKRDSVDFNSLMFPETGNFGFIFSPSWRLLCNKDSNSNHSLWLDGTFCYRKIGIDSPDVSFKINSVNIGLKYQWVYTPADIEDRFVFTLSGYWNLFNVPDEDVTKFNSVINDPVFLKVNKNAEIYSLGLKTSVQYKTFLFFADLRRNIKTKSLDDNSPFKGTKFNIGFATLLRLKSI
jgi:hypothetical protein